jgi:hypothetical protein
LIRSRNYEIYHGADLLMREARSRNGSGVALAARQQKPLMDRMRDR